MGREIRVNFLAEISLKKKSFKKSVTAVTSSPSEGLEREAEMKSLVPGSLLIMVFVFGSYCLGRIHNASWLKLRTLYAYLNHIPKSSACERGQTAEHGYLRVTFPSHVHLGEKNTSSAYQLMFTKEMQGDVYYKT